MLLNHAQTIQTHHLLFHFEAENSAFAQQLSKTLENTLSGLCLRYDLLLPADSHDLFICGRVDDYIALTGKKKDEYQDWMVGWADLRVGRICLLRQNGSSPENDLYLQKVMRHELVHMAFDSLSSDPDRVICWLAEGIAILEADQTERELLSLEDFPTIAMIDGRGECDAFYDNGGYDYAGVYVAHFLRRYGINRFKQVYQNGDLIGDFLYDGFEREAVAQWLADTTAKNRTEPAGI